MRPSTRRGFARQLPVDVADVRAALRVTDVLDRFSVEYRDRPEIRLAVCPACRQQQRRASVVVDRESGRWIHHSGATAEGAPCKGDILALVAALAGLDVRRDFPRVLELAAEIAGVTPDSDPAELARIRAEHRARTAARERRAADERARGEEMVPGIWATLEGRHLRGERYLIERELDPAALRRCGDVVRFYPDGSPAVLLHNLETGTPVNIVQRQLDNSEYKILSLDLGDVLGTDDVVGGFSTLGTLVGRSRDIDPDGVDVAVLVEGVADSLAALLAFPTCAVVGANGAYRMPHVAAAIAPRLVAARGWLLVAVHDDKPGIAGAGEALRTAAAAGLELGASVYAVELGAHKDLADAWLAGWRWTWLGTGRPGGAA
jgi:hypothetical protein